MKALALAFLVFASAASAQEAPEWFVETFLDLREDAVEAAKDGKRLMLYFMQDGCPYCKRLVGVNFQDERIVAKLRRHFMPVAINIWGDREVTLPDGRRMPEKRFAAALKVQFTPTLVFFDEQGAPAHRINGYLPPEDFYAALDPAIGVPRAAAGRDSTQIDLRRKSAKPVAVLLLSSPCDGCAELERHLATPQLRAQLSRFELVRASHPATVVTAKGSRQLSSDYLPAIVFFRDDAEVFRTEAYLRPFHLASAFEYVASRGYAREPSFQRFLQARAERLRARGERVDLWD